MRNQRASLGARRLIATVVLACLTATTCLSSAEGATLKVVVRDAEEGQPLRARLILRTSEGKYPGDRLGAYRDRWPGIEAHGIFVDGSAEFELPDGSTSITAGRGPQFLPLRQEIVLPEKGEKEVEFRLQRYINLQERGWVGGDAHLHMIHGERQREVSYRDVAVTAEGNGCEWLSVGQEYVGAGELTYQEMREECQRVSNENFRLWIGAERPKGILGHFGLLGIRDVFAIPDDPPYHRAAELIHDNGGILYPVHPLRYYPGKEWKGMLSAEPGCNMNRAVLFEALCGPTFDALSVISDEATNVEAEKLWFNLLNRGLFVPVFADSDACYDRPVFGFHAPGFWLTYVYIGDQLVTQKALVEGVNRGQTFATTGPIVLFSIDGKISGTTLPTDGKRREVKIEAHYPFNPWTLGTSNFKGDEEAVISEIALIRNGQAIKRWLPQQKHCSTTYTITENETCWYAAKVSGNDTKWQSALASPIYFAPKEKPRKQPPFAATIRGRVYDFKTGEPVAATVEVQRHGTTLKGVPTTVGQFALRMPVDATIRVSADGYPVIEKGIFYDVPGVHRFISYLEPKDLSDPVTFVKLEELLRDIQMEFPLGYGYPGCYIIKPVESDLKFEEIELLSGPASLEGESLVVSGILTDKLQVQPGDTISFAALFRFEGTGKPLPSGEITVAGKAWDAQHPSAYGGMKTFAAVSEKIGQQNSVGEDYFILQGSLQVPGWAGSDWRNAVEIAVSSRLGGKETSLLSLDMPLGETKRAIVFSVSFPNMPAAWRGHSLGYGPLRARRTLLSLFLPGSAVRADYRKLRLRVTTADGEFTACPAEDCRGCPDSDDAMFYEHVLNQVLSVQSRFAKPDVIRCQPRIEWTHPPLVDAAEIVTRDD